MEVNGFTISLHVLTILVLAAKGTDALDIATKESKVALNRYDKLSDNFATFQKEVDDSVSEESGRRQRRQAVSRLNKPLNPRLQAINSTCVNFSWDAPTPSSNVSGYRYYCNTSSFWLYTNLTTLSVVVCDFTPYEQVDCRVASRNSSGYGEDAVSSPIRTTCTAPDKPRGLTNNSSLQTTHNGRERWKLTFSWQVPAAVNCASLSEYKIWYQIQNQSWIYANTNSATKYIHVYADGNEQVQVFVAARNNDGLESINATLKVTSPALRPQLGPRSVILKNLNSTCATLQWQHPEWPNGPITGSQHKCTEASSWTIIIGNGTSSTICGFSPYERIQCDISAKNSAGYSDVSSSNETYTDCAAPSKPVLSITDSVTTASDGKDKVTVLVTWQSVIKNCRSVTYQASLILAEQVVESKADGSFLRVQFSDLDPQTNYTVLVVAKNNKGFEAESGKVWLTNVTRPAPPSFDLIFNTSCVSLSISAPEHPYNVVTHYKYNCQYATQKDIIPQRTTVNASNIDQGELQTLCRFLSAAEVSCNVSAVNTVGESLSVQNSGYTKIKIKNQQGVEYVTSDVIKCEVKVNLQQVYLSNPANSVSKYRVIASLPLTNQLTKRSASNVLDECNTTQLLDYAAATNLDLSCYITAEVEGSVVGDDGYTFTLGDSNTYGEFHNAPLVAKEEYTLLVAVVVDVQDDEELVYYLPSTDITSPSSKCSTCSTGCIVGITVGAIIACVAAVAIARLICIKRRQSAPPDTVELENQTKSAATPKGAKKKEHDDVNEYESMIRARSVHMYDEFVPKPNLYENVSEMRANPAPLSGQTEMSIIKQEFETLERTVSAIKFKYSNANSNLNECKNRFADILPSSEHAVTLSGGGYINAVFVDAFPDRKFVVTQLPLELTTGDFWKMVLEQNITIVVQLTPQTVEFYPEDDGDELYLDSCEVQKLKQADNELLSTIRIGVAGTEEETTEVMVIRIKDWMDGVERTDRLPKPSSLLYYFDVMETYRGEGKVCITDGDGCSESGLFITAYNMVSCLKSTQHTDVYSTALNARSKRKQFLSSFENYRYLYELLDFYKRNTEQASAS